MMSQNPVLLIDEFKISTQKWNDSQTFELLRYNGCTI